VVNISETVHVLLGYASVGNAASASEGLRRQDQKRPRAYSDPNVLMLGPPGAGKSMLARRMPLYRLINDPFSAIQGRGHVKSKTSMADLLAGEAAAT
jgi:sigma54-dependent transcription regulator